MKRHLTVALLMLVAALTGIACGSRVSDKGKGSNANSSSNSSTSNNGTNATNSVLASCGDGVLDAGELCDPAIGEGAGACPQSCGAPACSTAMLVGSAEQCTAQCIVEPLACATGDSCCPAGCDAATDADCTNQCGDGVTEGPETCDGNCPTQCSDGDVCTTDALTGSAAGCSAACSFTPVASCTSGDGCCPAGCTSDRDSDCAPTATCGNGTLDPGELCDGNCPTTCDDGVACTTDVLSGSAASCNARCSTTPITACVNGDGCCPQGCSRPTDNDCACTPRTCAQAGAECGMIDNLCGSTITCPDTCSTLETCSNNTCVAQNSIGTDCTDYPDCGSSPHAACILPPDWPGGYCSLLCDGSTGNTACPVGSHCTSLDGQSSLCMLDCTTNAQCESGYVCQNWDGAGGKECSPPVTPGTGQLGDPCVGDADCSGALSCAQEYTNSSTGTTTTFPGGVCTEACVLLQCTTATTGVCTLDMLCMEACTVSADCRPGWSCIVGLPLPLGNYCWPD